MRTFHLDEALALMPSVLAHAEQLIQLRADLAELRYALRVGQTSALGGLAERKGLEASFHEAIEWFGKQGIQLKGIAPLLIDFPAVLAGQEVLLCWLEGEPALGWYHTGALGFMGRRPMPTRSDPDSG